MIALPGEAMIGPFNWFSAICKANSGFGSGNFADSGYQYEGGLSRLVQAMRVYTITRESGVRGLHDKRTQVAALVDNCFDVKT